MSNLSLEALKEILESLPKPKPPQVIIASIHDVLELSRELRKIGASFKRIRKGYWIIQDKQLGLTSPIMELYINRFAKKGESYGMPKTLLEFPRAEHDSIMWMRYRRW